MAGAQLAATAFDVLRSAVAKRRHNPLSSQNRDEIFDVFLIRALEVTAFRRIDGNEIDHGVATGHKLGQTLDFFESVVNARQQRPLNLRRILGLLGVVQGALQQVLGS